MTKCERCREDVELPFKFQMAFQPIVDMGRECVWGYEALVRGPNGEPAAEVLKRLTDETLYQFDQQARVMAIETAGRLFDDPQCRLSINFMPNAVYEPRACIQKSLAAAKRVGFDETRLMFEFTENERIVDASHVQSIIKAYREYGFTIALDDFGAGFAGLALLSRLQPDLIKIDMELIRDIDESPAKRAIVRGVTRIAEDLGIQVLAEGVETDRELAFLRDLGISLFQGYLFARPALMALPTIRL